MADPVINDTACIALNYTDGIGTFGSRFYVAGPLPSSSDSDYLAVAGAIGSAWASHMAGVTHSTYALQSVGIRTMESLKSPFQTNTTGWDGSGSGDPLSSNCTGDISFQVSYRYRGGHPLIHLPGVTFQELENQREWSSSALVARLDAWEAFIAAVIAAFESEISITVEHAAVLSPSATGSGAYTSVPVNAYTARQQVGSMRRRARVPR